MSDAEISQFCAVTAASPTQAGKYLERFATFESAVDSFLENPEKSPIRPPDAPYRDCLVDEKKKLIKSTTDESKSFRLTIQKQQCELNSTGSVRSSHSNHDLDFLSSVSCRGTLEQIKKRATVLGRFVLLSFYDKNQDVCKKQTSEVWNNDPMKEIFQQNLLLIQQPIENDDYKTFVDLYRLGKTIRNDQWPHAALIDPRTGELLKEWFGKESSCRDQFHDSVMDIVNGRCSADFGIKISKKRTFSDITDQTEDDQLAIAIAASMKSTKRIKSSKMEEIADIDKDPEMNSDFESVSECEDDSDGDQETVEASDETPPMLKPQKRIRIQVRTSKNQRICIEMLSSADSTELRQKLLNEGYCPTQFDLIRAYPKQLMDLSKGKTLEDLSIKNHDAFLLQPRC